MTGRFNFGIILINMDINEKKEKERRLKKFLKNEELDGVLLNKQHNFAWFTGGGRNYVSTATEQGSVSLLLTRKEKIIIANNIEKPRILEEEIEKNEFKFKEFKWYQNQKEMIKTLIKGKKLAPTMGSREQSISRQK